MSLTGSLIPYEDGGVKKPPKIARCNNKDRPTPLRKKSCCQLHLNSLWSLWYGLCLTGFQSYLSAGAARRFLSFAGLPWHLVTAPPRLEMHACAALIGAAALILPLFLLSAIFKVGNLANDGFKLGRNLSTCTADPPSSLVGNNGQGVFRSLWQHGGPTAPFLHLTSAFCLLLPRLLMEARLIQAGFLSKDALWKTDLDFMVVHRDRLVILNFFTSPPVPSNLSFVPTPQPFASTSDAQQPATSPAAIHQLQDLIGADFVNDTDHYISLEFWNYALALVVYAVRYPSLFWNTNKCFGILFSFQLLGNAVHALMSYAGMSILYKVQVLGATEALPALNRGHSLGSPFLLDAYVTLALFVLSAILVLSSSLVLYLYGLGRFNAFLNTERDRRVIVLSEGRSGGWGYFTHCAALCVLLALAVCHAPLLHDYTVVYRGSLDGAILVCVVAAISHLFLWVVVWLVLTVKQHWIFRLRVTVGRAAVRSARSVKLVTDVDLVANNSEAAAPLLVVGGGRTYTVTDTSPKKAIMGVIQKTAMERKSRLAAQGSAQVDDDDTEIYWLRPKPCSPKYSPSDPAAANFFKKTNSSQKHKVTFNEVASKNPQQEGAVEFEDDGDYATLRMGGPGSIAREDTVSEENKLLERVLQDESVTFLRSREPLPDYEDPSQDGTLQSHLPPPEAEDLPLPPAPPPASASQPSQTDSKGGTPRCLRRADSGMQDELTPRSGSVSSGGSPPGAQGSESSSGVHSNGSSRRATSVDDLTAVVDKAPAWRSCSLQRNVLPPGAPGSAHLYSFGSPLKTDQMPNTLSGVPAVILENPEDNTVVIRRKANRPLTADLTRPLELKEEPFSRSTNMRMTSFTDEGSSATLPHFPTQMPPPPALYPCNTMPLPCPVAVPMAPMPPTSCHAFPRPHTTIPTHLNGVRLFPSPVNAPYAKRLQHTGLPRLPRPERDSANFSMASSGDSDSHS